MTRIMRYALAALLIGTVCGCRYSLPPGFVKVDPIWDTRVRAVSAEGAAITLRVETNPENGDLAFWEKAIMTRLVEFRGYRLADRREIKHGDETPGVQMTFDYQRDGIDYTYVVNVMVKGRKVYCIEIAGEKTDIAPQLTAISDAVRKWPLS
ncbi:MAG TPA: hypothetical protein PLL20_00935 [Phycisphaerae bacterium]|nr:hypothetical protein [Phycisphaerae bacterium]HRR86297.1 hypothetical protein [Phycisphaerae bacterium]